MPLLLYRLFHAFTSGEDTLEVLEMLEMLRLVVLDREVLDNVRLLLDRLEIL